MQAPGSCFKKMWICLETLLVHHAVREGLNKKKRQIIHFFKINNIHIKEFFYPHAANPPPLAYPLSVTPPPYPPKVDNLPFFLK